MQNSQLGGEDGRSPSRATEGGFCPSTGAGECSLWLSSPWSRSSPGAHKDDLCEFIFHGAKDEPCCRPSGCTSQEQTPLVGQVGVSTQHICPWLWLSRMPVHVRQPSEAGAPVLEVVVVLVFISQAGQDGAQSPCHRAIALVVIDESCVVRRHTGVAVRCLQALWKGPTDLRTTQASREPSGTRPQAGLALPLS